MAEATLEHRLLALGEAMAFRDEEVLADDVLAALDDVDTRADVGGGRSWRRPVLVAAAVLVVVVGVALAVPDSRDAIARWLGFDALRIERVDVVPPTVTVPAGPEGLTLDAAAERVGVRPVVAPTLGPPLAVETPLDRYVVVRYDEALVATLPGTLDDGLFTKLGTAGVDIDRLEVNGAPAYWITGDDHVFLYTDESGVVRESRTAADTLVWARDDVIVRIEGDLTLDRALEIARSVRQR